MYYIKRIFKRLKKTREPLENYKKEIEIHIPSEIIIEWSLFLKYKDLVIFMRTDKQIYKILKSSNYLWKKKFIQEFGENSKIYAGPNPYSWFEVTKSLLNLENLKKNLKHYKYIESFINKSGNELIKQKVDKIRNNFDIVLKSVKNDGLSLEYVSEEFKDKNVVEFAVRNNGLALQYASEELKDDKNVVEFAVKNNGLALQFASDILKDCWSIILISVQDNGLALQFASHRIKDSKFIVSCAVKNNGLALQLASDKIKDNKTIVSYAVKNNGLALQYASDRI